MNKPKRPLDQDPHFVPCKTGDVLTNEQLAKLFPGNREVFMRDLLQLGREAYAKPEASAHA